MARGKRWERGKEGGYEIQFLTGMAGTRAKWARSRETRMRPSARAEAADGRLGKRIGSVKEYGAFRAWIAEKGLDAQAVKDSAHAWISYALGAEGLFGNEPAIVLGGVTVEGGGAPVGVSKVAGMFEVTRNLMDWEGEAKVTASATPAGRDGATMRFAVTLGDGTEKSSFLRLVP